MNKLAIVASSLFAAATATTAMAQPGPDQPPLPSSCCTQTEQAAAAQPTRPVAAVEPAQQPAPSDDDGWHRPPGERFMHGFRIGWTYIQHFDELTREKDGMPTSLKEKYGLKTPHMMLIGYEGFYRVIGHSWLNVVMVGNVTVAGLEQSKFIPAVSGLIGAEFNENFQLGIGVNLTPDPEAPTHAIIAAGWTPRVGSIHTPVHFFYVPEPGKDNQSGNSRFGATVGVTW